MKFGAIISAVVLSALATTPVQAQTTEEAQAMLKDMMALVKAKGVAKASEDINAGTDPGKCKEKPGITCMIITDSAKVLANGKNPKMAGQEFPPDFADVEGTPIVAQFTTPLKSGKAKWEARFKFAPAGSKKIMQQHAFCEKFDANTAVCGGLQNAP